MPDSRETYIHRLGRTGRAGKAGRGVIVLSPFEAGFIKELKGIDCPLDVALQEMLHAHPAAAHDAHAERASPPLLKVRGNIIGSCARSPDM